MSIVLVAGNFINMGGYAGNAAGFKLDSLLKMDDTKANKPRMTLTHYVVQVVEDSYPHILDIEKKLPNLERASRLSLDTLQSDLNELKKKVTSVGWSLEEAEEDVKQQMTDFFDASDTQLNTLENLMEDVNKLANRLATFFCEDPGVFKLEAIFQVINSFVTRLNAAHQENIQRKQREDGEKKRRQQQAKKEKGKEEKAEESSPTTQAPEVPYGCVDQLLFGIRGGSKLRQSVKARKEDRGKLMALKKCWDGDILRVGSGMVLMTTKSK
jgi:dGTP triphosphohydrolase